MSDTNKGSKGPGYDYWSKRPQWTKTPKPSKLAKRWTHKRERQQGKKETTDEI